MLHHASAWLLLSSLGRGLFGGPRCCRPVALPGVAPHSASPAVLGETLPRGGDKGVPNPLGCQTWNR